MIRIVWLIQNIPRFFFLLPCYRSSIPTYIKINIPISFLRLLSQYLPYILLLLSLLPLFVPYLQKNKCLFFVCYQCSLLTCDHTLWYSRSDSWKWEAMNTWVTSTMLFRPVLLKSDFIDSPSFNAMLNWSHTSHNLSVCTLLRIRRNHRRSVHVAPRRSKWSS